MLSTELTMRLGARVPIFGFAHSLEVTLALSKAGGIGIWGATRNTPDEIREGLAWLAERADGLPYGVDLVLPTGMPERNDRAVIEAQIPDEHRQFIQHLREKYDVPDDGQPGVRSRFVRSEEVAEAQISAVLASDVPLLAMGVGSPHSAIARAKSDGKFVAALVGAPQHAERALANGADMLVAQGYDAGAHTGEIGTFSLVPKVVEIAGDVPVVVAGGVATGAHLAAALALGGSGVWMGTAWLFTEEHALDPMVLAKLSAAGMGDTVRSRADSGKTLRQIVSPWTEEWSAPGAPKPLRMPLQDVVVGDFLGAVERHRVEPLMKSEAGQSVGYFHGLTTVADIVAKVTQEAEDALRRMASHLT